jgi:hypothetical protein
VPPPKYAHPPPEIPAWAQLLRVTPLFVDVVCDDEEDGGVENYGLDFLCKLCFK